MAKKSAIEKNLNKEKQVKKNKSRRDRLVAICKNRSTGRNIRINTPTTDVTKCPKKTFFGWAKGLSGYPKSKTIEEPNDPARNNP